MSKCGQVKKDVCIRHEYVGMASMEEIRRTPFQPCMRLEVCGEEETDCSYEAEPRRGKTKEAYEVLVFRFLIPEGHPRGRPQKFPGSRVFSIYFFFLFCMHASRSSKAESSGSRFARCVTSLVRHSVMGPCGRYPCHICKRVGIGGRDPKGKKLGSLFVV